MPELRKDPVTGRWVVIAPDRQKRPNDFRIERASVLGAENCPFCPGHESMTPPEVLAYRPDGGPADSGGWEVRVVPNKIPALCLDGAPGRQTEGLFEQMNGVGAHEVIIESPEHSKTLAMMSEPEIERVLWAYRERMNDLKRDRRLRYILIFKNQGPSAGATLAHTHSQLIGLPIVPDYMRDEIEGARRHFSEKRCCLFCDIIRQEAADGRRVVHENGEVIALSPWAPRFPYETWLLPKMHGARFEDAPRQQYEGLARMIKSVLMRIDRALERPDYNLLIHSLPFSEQAADLYHWHVEILPKLTRTAGFEWGTGFYINTTSPEEATRTLRTVELP